MRDDLPGYRELPLLHTDGDYRHAWDVYPPGENLGCLRNLTSRARRRGFATVRENTVVNISLPMNHPDPPLFGRQPLQHTVFSPSRNVMDDRLDRFFTQASTQWDGFRHVRAREFGFFTGHPGASRRMTTVSASTTGPRPASSAVVSSSMCPRGAPPHPANGPPGAM